MLYMYWWSTCALWHFSILWCAFSSFKTFLCCTLLMLIAFFLLRIHLIQCSFVTKLAPLNSVSKTLFIFIFFNCYFRWLVALAKRNYVYFFLFIWDKEGKLISYICNLQTPLSSKTRGSTWNRNLSVMFGERALANIKLILPQNVQFEFQS